LAFLLFKLVEKEGRGRNSAPYSYTQWRVTPGGKRREKVMRSPSLSLGKGEGAAMIQQLFKGGRKPKKRRAGFNPILKIKERKSARRGGLLSGLHEEEEEKT